MMIKFLALMQPSDWIAISSVVVAICAFVISVWQGFLARRHAHLSARPIMESNFNSGSEAGLEIYNAGLGPALLTNFTAIYQGTHFDLFRGSEHERLLHALITNKSFFPVLSINSRVPSQYSAIAPSEVVRVLSVTSGYESTLDGIRSSFSEIKLNISYKDIYGKRFICHHKSGINS